MIDKIKVGDTFLPKTVMYKGHKGKMISIVSCEVISILDDNNIRLSCIVANGEKSYAYSNTKLLSESFIKKSNFIDF